MLGKNLLGIYEKAFDPSDNWNKRLAKAKQCGFDFLEISIDENDERLERLYWSRIQKENLRHAIWNNEMPILSMCLSGHRRFPFGSADSNAVLKAYEIMERAIDFALEIGVRTIQLAGYDVYYEKSDDRTVKRFLNGLHFAVEKAAQKEIMLAMEIMDTPLINTITKYRWYKEQLNSPWFRVYPDIGNLTAWNNDVGKEIRENIADIVAVHLKDTLAVTNTFPGKFRCVPFGTGCVNFSGFFSLMDELNYAGPYLVEMWHKAEDEDITNVISAKQFLEKEYSQRGE